jgi:hypothetical protein
MPLTGERVAPTPVTVGIFDNTTNANLTNITYAAGAPEVGITFVAPATGRVLLTVGGGVRNNAANGDRVFLAPEVFAGSDATGSQILAPSVAPNGAGSGGGFATDDFRYLCRTTMLTGLTAGATYYVRIVHETVLGSATADIAAREITVQPAT